MWYHDRVILRLIEKERKRDAQLKGRLFFGVSDEDTPSIVCDLALLEKQRAERPFDGLEILYQNFPGQNHYTVIEDGLTALYSENE